ncbi:CsgE family curli-type amyloid fiber assembly protein [Hymenobacter lapidiphilus]|uniref:CsgE family curli-type amyloid fiber assembly protein n=1 Tax=Hymenobacter sp. CCM 8763 TaxID=2303334 RepID=UPI00190EE5A5|nr:CsgE family curli-type amyloid fiber assembly protein [Hymenobacter sp. CCM 8763]
MLLAPAALAQGVRQPPARVKQQGSPAPAQAPTNESKANPLTPKQLEEALRLLLQVTADSTNTGKFQRGFEVDGLIVDETITKLGRDFYSLFFNTFEAPAGSGDYVVTITEKPARSTSILVTVAVNNTDLLEMPLQPNEEYIEAAASEAVGTVTQHLIENNRLGNELEQGNSQPLEVY